MLRQVMFSTLRKVGCFLIFLFLFVLFEVEGIPKNGQQRAQICKTFLKPFQDICAPVPDEQDVRGGKGTVDFQKQKEASVSVEDEDGLDEENETGFDENIISEGCPIENCSVCYDGKTCSTCKRGFRVQFDSETEKSICVENCFVGYQQSTDSNGNEICKMPASDCFINHCMECFDKESCISCQRGYFTQLEIENERFICVKNCFMGYYPTLDELGTYVCKRRRAISSTVGCLDLLCTACRNGYFSLQTNGSSKRCSRTCPHGYLKDRITRRCVLYDQMK